MYLTAKKYLYSDERKDKVQELFSEIKCKVTTIEFELIYWRKANAIHKWFVDNVQEGNDDCKNYYVADEQLRKLLNLIEKVLKNRELAGELLPTQKGFFFGGEEYDEYYWGELERTQKELNNLLISGMEESFYYQSSW